MDARGQSQRIREHLWHRLASEYRDLEKVLVDVQALAAVGSFETARKRFGQFRLAHERHLRAVQTLESLLAGRPGTSVFLSRVQRERARITGQSDRVWSQLCRERSGQVPRLLSRLSALVVEHEQTLHRLILGEPPLTAAHLGVNELQRRPGGL